MALFRNYLTLKGTRGRYGTYKMIAFIQSYKWGKSKISILLYIISEQRLTKNQHKGRGASMERGVKEQKGRGKEGVSMVKWEGWKGERQTGGGGERLIIFALHVCLNLTHLTLLKISATEKILSRLT